MAGYNFGRIGDTLSRVMDTDRMDICRRVETTNPDGSTGETTEAPLYSDVPCHISFHAPDAADSGVADTAPVAQSVTIHCPLDVDLHNADNIRAHKCDADGSILETYSGYAGFHTVDQARQSVQLTVKRG